MQFLQRKGKCGIIILIFPSTCTGKNEFSLEMVNPPRAKYRYIGTPLNKYIITHIQIPCEESFIHLKVMRGAFATRGKMGHFFYLWAGLFSGDQVMLWLTFFHLSL